LAQGQYQRGNRMDERSMQQLLQRIETGADRFRVSLEQALDQSRRLRRVHASTRWVRSICHAGADVCRAAPLVPSSFSRRRGPIEQGGGERSAPCNATFAKDQRGLRRDGARRGAPPEGNLGVRAPEQEVGGDVAF